MHIKKVEGQVTLLGIPEGLRVLVFGMYNDPDYNGYFAFLAPTGVRILVGESIAGVRYAEGAISDFSLMDNQVIARRSLDGSYEFSVKVGGSAVSFKLNHPSWSESCYEDSPVTVLCFQLGS